MVSADLLDCRRLGVRIADNEALRIWIVIDKGCCPCRSCNEDKMDNRDAELHIEIPPFVERRNRRLRDVEEPTRVEDLGDYMRRGMLRKGGESVCSMVNVVFV